MTAMSPRPSSPLARSLRTLALVVSAAVAVVATGAAAQPAPVTLEPVLDLAFDGSLADSSPLAHPTTARATGGGTPTHTFTTGRVGGSALKLSGTTYLDLGTSAALQPSDLTLSFWLRPDVALSGEEVITWNKQAYNSDGFYLSSESNTSPLALSVGPGGAQPYKLQVASTDRAAFFPTGQWTHIAVSYSSSTKQAVFYRNGVRTPSRTAFGVAGASTGVITGSTTLPKTIGFNGPQYNGAFLRGSLDEYKLFRGIATASDVAGLFEQDGGVIDKTAIARADADGLVVPTTASLAVVLPSEGDRGSAVTWTSSDTDVIAPDGTVHPPSDEDASVTLTATVRFADGPAVTKDFVVSVPAVRESLQDSGLDVLLSDDYLQNAAAKEHEYLLSLSSETFLYWFYRTAGLTPPTASGYGGWEDGNVSGNFRGHAFGHYMSALAMSYASTRDATTKAALHAKIVSAVDGLATVQATYAGTADAGYLGPFRDTALDAVEGRGSSNDPVIVPYYNLHKVLAGLLDIQKYVPDASGSKAGQVAAGFGEYLYGRVSTLADTSVMLRTEYGGMNESLYELYARTGNPHIKVAAQGFDEVSLFRDLAAGRDVLNGKHANTTIPKLLGALKRYTVFTQDADLYATLTEQEKADLPMYLDAARNFWQIVVDDHTYATGANSQSEHFHGPDTLYQYATQMGEGGNPQTAETCNEYNMLKLSRELFKLTHEVKYADYYENTFINTILSSQNPDTGMTTYFQAMAPGYTKLYGMPFTDFWCCIGTGMENFSKLGDSIYFKDGKSLWVNMFFSSTVDHPGANLRLEQDADLPNDDTVRLSVSAITGTALSPGTQLRLRVPDWAAAAPTLTVNGDPVAVTPRRGYIVLDVAAGDQISYRLPMAVRAVSTPDNTGFVAFKYGPVLLSAGLGTSNLGGSSPVGIGVRVPVRDKEAQQVIVVDDDSVTDWVGGVAQNVEQVSDTADGQVQFALRNTVDGGALRFTPHYLRHDERYGIYFTYEVKDSAAAQARILAQKKRDRELAFTIDSLTSFDNNNFENAKNLKSSGSEVGNFNGEQFRHAFGPSGWFSYDLEVDPSAPRNLLLTRYYTGDVNRTFAVYLNDQLFKTERITNTAGTNVFYLQSDEIPRALLDAPRWKVDTQGNPVLDEQGNRVPVVTVRFQSTGGFVGGLFGVHTSLPVDYDTDPTLSGLSADTGELSPAFAPATSAYVLEVPAGTRQVGLTLTPHLPTGLVEVDGVLVDDRAPRRVDLVPGQEKVVTVRSLAQDHTTARTTTVTIREVSAPAPTTTGARLLANPVQVGTSAVVLGTVRGTGTVPTGTVQVLDDGQVLASGTVKANGTYRVVLPRTLAAGPHQLTVRYAGSPGFAASQRTLSLTVTASSSTTSVSVTPTAPTPRTVLRATVQVLPEAAVPVTGQATVVVRRGATVVTTVEVTMRSGRVTTVLGKLPAGSYTVQATYAGSAQVSGSQSGPVAFTVR